MLSIVTNDASGANVNSPTIAEIARAVPMGAALQMAETAWAAHRQQRETIGAELTAVCVAARETHGHIDRERINSLTAEVEAIERKIVPAREKSMELRRARADKVAAALVDVRLNAARRLVAATAELAAAFNDLRSCCEEIRRAGDPDQDYFHPPAVGQVLDHAQRIITRHSR